MINNKRSFSHEINVLKGISTEIIQNKKELKMCLLNALNLFIVR